MASPCHHSISYFFWYFFWPPAFRLFPAFLKFICFPSLNESKAVRNDQNHPISIGIVINCHKPTKMIKEMLTWLFLSVGVQHPAMHADTIVPRPDVSGKQLRQKQILACNSLSSGNRFSLKQHDDLWISQCQF